MVAFMLYDSYVCMVECVHVIRTWYTYMVYVHGIRTRYTYMVSCKCVCVCV